MDMKISKELLSEVLALDIREIEYNEKYNFIRYGYWNSCVNNQNEDISGIDYLKINIYELAHKCKVWAYKQGYSLKSEYAEKLSSCGIYLKDDFSYELDGSIMQTEVEAVIEACQWILDNQ